MHDIQTGIFLKATVQMTEIKLSTDIFGSELNGKFGSFAIVQLIRTRDILWSAFVTDLWNLGKPYCIILVHQETPLF